MNLDDIETFVNSQKLDIRNKKNNPRFIDQKCTPDVLYFIAETVADLGKETFLPKDVWNNDNFIKLIPIIFGKPSPKNHSARNEYNKFIGQNLELLAYAGVLRKNKLERPYSYTIIKKEILEYIGQNDKHAFLFLHCYFNKFLQDSNLIQAFEKFFNEQTQAGYDKLKEKFIRFMQVRTKIGSRGGHRGGRAEIMRMFPKLVNILAVNKRAKGSIRGHLSSGIMTYDELMYNRKNFRDIRNKEKHITRKENAQEQKSNLDNLQISRAKNIIKKLHPHSEIKDNSAGKTSHLHHIFPQSEFLSISSYKENLIALTVEQHLNKAHPNGNTFKIDPSYQHLCLLEKMKSIQINSAVYSKESFIHVINTGFGWIDTDEELKPRASFKEIEEAINYYYRNT